MASAVGGGTPGEKKKVNISGERKSTGISNAPGHQVEDTRGKNLGETSTRGQIRAGIKRNESGGWDGQSCMCVCVEGQRDSTASETGDEEDIESPLLDPIPWDPRVLLPQFCNE